MSEFNEGGTLLPWITLNVTIFGTCTLDEKCWVCECCVYLQCECGRVEC